MVWGSREYTTTFFLNPQACDDTAKDVNFQKDCSGEEEDTDPTTPGTPNQTEVDQPAGSLVFADHIKISRIV